MLQRFDQKLNTRVDWSWKSYAVTITAPVSRIAFFFLVFFQPYLFYQQLRLVSFPSGVFLPLFFLKVK